MGCGFSKDGDSNVATTAGVDSSFSSANKNKRIASLPMRDDDLSDISSVGSKDSAYGRTSTLIKSALTDHDRDETVPNIEEELFVYDDVVLARPSQWRPRNPKFAGSRTKLPSTPVAGATRRRSSGNAVAPHHSHPVSGSTLAADSGSEVFMFSDFVCPMVDEVEFAVSVRDSNPTTEAINPSLSKSEVTLGAAVNPLSASAASVSTRTLGTESVLDFGSIRSAPPISNGPSVRLANGTICRATNVCNTKSKQLFQAQQATAVRARGYNSVHAFNVTHHIGHPCRVKCIAVAPGDSEFVSCSNEDSVLTLVSVKSGQEVSNFAGHQDTVISATFSADGKYLATTSRDHTMILWDVVTAKQILQFDHAKVVICCTFSRDSRFVATGCQDKVCRLWETRKGRETVFFPDHDGIIICMSYSPDNCFIASASADKTIRVWSTTTGKAKHVLKGHSGIVLSCSFTNDGLRIISNDEKLVKIWEATSGSCIRTISVEDFVSQSSASLSKKLTWTLSCVAPGLFTKFIVVACNNRFVYVFDITTGKEVASYFCKAPVYCLASGYINMVAFGDSFGNLYLAEIV